MKIVFLCNEYPPCPRIGGIGVFTHTIAHGLVAAGHEVTVLGYGKNHGERHDSGVRVVILPELSIRKLAWFVNLRRLYSWLKREVRTGRIDILETPEYQGMLPFRFPYCPVVVRLHLNAATIERIAGRKARWESKWLEKRTVSLHRNWISVSNYIFEETQKEFKRIPVRHRTIYNPYKINGNTAKILPTTNVLPSYVLFAGTVSDRKGAFVLAEAACSFLVAHPDLHLVYVGRITEENGQRTDETIRRILGQKLVERVHFTGAVEHDLVLAYMKKAKVFAFPSKLEAFGLAPVEAMSCGVPVVYSTMHAGPEVIDNAVTGFLADPYSPDDVAEKVQIILSNPALASQIATSAKLAVKKRFSLSRCIDETLEFYELCITNRGSNFEKKISA